MLKRFLSIFILLVFAGTVIAADTNANYTIKLSSNPTTGYSWFLKSYDQTLLTLKSHQYVAPNTKLVGAGGYEVWTFAPTPAALKAPHTIPVTLIYARPWELKANKTGAIAEEKTVNIIVP